MGIYAVVFIKQDRRAHRRAFVQPLM